MTGMQRQLYRAAMRIGRSFGIGGATWTYYPPPSGDGVTGAVSLTADPDPRTIYFIEERLDAYGQPLPAQPVGVIPFRFVAPVDEDVSVGAIASNGEIAFTLTTCSTHQGYPTGKAEPCGVPGAVPSAGDALRDDGGNVLIGG